jgi:hypothetical protein
MKRILYKILLILGMIIVGGVVSIVLFLVWKIPFNNYKLGIFQKSFDQSIAKFHPIESKLLAKAAEVGNWADGTYCEFFVGQFRSSPLPREELEKIYPSDFFTTGVYFIDDNEAFGSSWFEWKEKYLKNYKAKDNENIYLVWKADYDDSPDGDIRCD